MIHKGLLGKILPTYHEGIHVALRQAGWKASEEYHDEILERASPYEFR